MLNFITLLMLRYYFFINLTLCWIWFKGRTIICGVISPGSIPGIQPEYNLI